MYEAEIHPSDIETSLRPSKERLGLWLAFKVIASPNSPNGGFNLPLVTHLTHPPPISAGHIIVVVKSCSKSSSVSWLAEIVIKH